MNKLAIIPVFLMALLASKPVSAQVTMGDLTKQQRDSIIFAFPKCTPGTVYMKDGSIAKSDLNYNYYEPQVLFRNDKPTSPEDTLRRLDNLGEVSLIEIGDRSFVPVLGTSLGEIIWDNRTISLVVTKKVNIEEKKAGAYGTGGSTSSIQSVSSFTGSSGVNRSGNYTGQTSFTSVNYDFASNAELSIDTRLFLLQGTKTLPVSKKNLTKAFPKAANFIKQYIDEQKTDLENPQEVINLINLANAQ